MKAFKIFLENLNFPEGPALDSKGNIWFVELLGGNVCRADKNGNVHRYAIEGGKPNGIAIDFCDNIWFCDAGNDCVSILDPMTGENHPVFTHVGDETLAHPNDLAFDIRGNLLFTCPGESRREPTGYVCVANADGVKKVITEKFFPNGLAFTHDGSRLAIAETYKHRIWIGDWNSDTLKWENPYVLAEVGGDIGPDGMAFAQDGTLYAAIYGGSSVKVISGDGTILKVLPVGGKNASNCAFLPDGRLIVSETERGRLVVLDTDVTGACLFNKPFDK